MNRFDTIFLSPHFDDAAFSCGGYLAGQRERGRTVLVVNVMAGDAPQSGLSDFAAMHHERWQLTDNPVALRKVEDQAAMAVLGVKYEYWEIPDCIYRKAADSGRHFYTTGEALFGQIDPAEFHLIDRLAHLIETLPYTYELLVPLGVGNHVDHQLVRLAAERTTRPLRYYEDYPYIRDPEAIDLLIDGPDPVWESEWIPMDESQLALKCDSIEAYRSQISTFFASPAEMRREISDFFRERGGERLWRRP